MILSIVIPVYNEQKTIVRVLETIRSLPLEKEIIVVDDGSSDGTRALLKDYDGVEAVRVILHQKNLGKGAAVRTGIGSATGEALIIQDADLEYDPRDYAVLLGAMQKANARVVYGSRFLSKKKVTSSWHRFVNYFLTSLTNVLFGSSLTDMETCYKLFRTDFIRSLDIRSQGFEIEVEMTAKTLLRKERIVETPISYKGRTSHEGKKIGWKDGVKAVASLFRYRFFGE